MRNLKKLLAVVLTVVMLASMMVPALAANTYEDEALKLQSIGMFAGEPADLKLEEGVTRIQGLAFAIRAAGKEADAFAMTDEEVATILDGYVDGADVPAWGRKYAAYAIKNGITVGVSATEKKFAALDPISGTSFLVFLMKAGMGYADVTTATVIEASVDAGILTAGQAAAFGAKAALIRDDAAGILYGAAMNGVNADGTALIEALIASGFVDADAALAAGFVEEEIPEDLEVVSVTAINLIQLVVEFNTDNFDDEDEVKDKGNYEFEGDAQSGSDTIAVKSTKLDGTTLTLTLERPVHNQSEGDLTIDKAVTGKKVEFEEIEFFDNTLPVIEEAKVVGKSTVKFYFSEPMNIADGDEDEFDFELNGKSFSPKKITSVANGYEANVELYGSLKDGTLVVEVDNGLKDYAGFSAKATTFELEVVEDDTAPVVVDYKDASRGEITLIFDEDIEFVDSNPDESDFYHTNTKNETDAIVVADAIDGNELTLSFDTNKLPEGSAYVYIKSGSVRDLWGNKNDTVKLKVEITVDDTPPTVEEIEMDSNKVEITFSEKLDKDSAEDLDNYKLLDSKDKKVAIRKASYSESDKEYVVTLTLRATADEGEYEITISGVEDKAGNEMDEYTDILELGDDAGPEEPAIYADGSGDEWDIYIQFNEAMAIDGTYAANDLFKYQLSNASGAPKFNFGDADDDDDYDITLKMMDDDETVKISIEGYTLLGSDTIVIARVADKAGNRSDWISSSALPITNVAAGTKINFAAGGVVATDVDKIEVEFTANVDTVDIDDFIVTDGTKVYDIDDIDIVDGNEIIIWLEDDLPTSTTGIRLDTVAQANIKTENSFGIPLQGGLTTVAIKDEIVPAVAELSDVDTSKTFAKREDGSDGEDDVQSVHATFDPAADQYTINVVFSEAILAVSKNLITVTAGGDKQTINGTPSLATTVVANDTLVIVVDNADPEAIIKGDSVDIKVVTDTEGNSIFDLALNIEYEVQLAGVASGSLTIAGLTAPVLGATPVATITAATEYTGDVVWYTGAAGSLVLFEEAAFEASTVYTAIVTLTAEPGYTFDDVAEDAFTVSGGTATNPAGSGVITVVFPATGS